MKRYKVTALSVGGKSKKLFESGDEVTEDQFEVGRAQQLAEQGFLKLIGEDDTQAPDYQQEQPELTMKVETPETPAPEQPIAPPDGPVEETDEFKGLTRNDLMDLLDAAEVTYSTNAPKKELFELYKKLPPKE